MLKQQSFKRGGRGRSQIVETRQGSKIDRREGEGGERRAGLGKGVRGKRRVFSKQCRCLHIEFLAWYLPNPYLPQGIWSRAPFASEKEQYLSSSSLVAAPRVGFEYPFPLAPPFPPRPLPSCLKISLPVSLSLSRMPQKVTCRLWRYSEAGALVFSGGAANLGCTGRGVSQCERVPQSTP